MKDLRETIIMTVVENSMIDIDNTGQERYTLDEEQFGLLIDNLVKKLTLRSFGSGFKVETYALINPDGFEYIHWSRGLKMFLKKDGVVMNLEGEEIVKIVRSLPKTVGGIY